MTRYRRDLSGGLSCLYRTDGFMCKDWCNKSLDFCCHGDDCRVPIPMTDPVGDIVRSTLALLRVSKDALEKSMNVGPAYYREQLDRINAAIAEGAQLLEEGE